MEAYIVTALFFLLTPLLNKEIGNGDEGIFTNRVPSFVLFALMDRDWETIKL